VPVAARRRVLVVERCVQCRVGTESQRAAAVEIGDHDAEAVFEAEAELVSLIAKVDRDVAANVGYAHDRPLDLTHGFGSGAAYAALDAAVADDGSPGGWRRARLVSLQRSPATVADLEAVRDELQTRLDHISTLAGSRAAIIMRRLTAAPDDDLVAPEIRWSILGDLVGGDVEAIAFLVLMEAARSAQEDLKALMALMKSNTAAKKRLREQLEALDTDAGDSETQERVESKLNGYVVASTLAKTDMQNVLQQYSQVLSLLSNVSKSCSTGLLASYRNWGPTVRSRLPRRDIEARRPTGRRPPRAAFA
jgi:hypothetical protein